LKKGIGMALVPTFVDPEAELGVQIRTRREIFASHPLPFVDTSVRG
jgi:aminomethyltransferase